MAEASSGLRASARPGARTGRRARRRRGERGGGLLYVVPRPVGRHPRPARARDDRRPGHGRGADRSARRHQAGFGVDERGRRPHRNGRRQGGLVLGHHRRRHDGRSAHRQVVGRDRLPRRRWHRRRRRHLGAITAGWSALGRPGPRSEDCRSSKPSRPSASTGSCVAWEDGLRTARPAGGSGAARRRSTSVHRQQYLHARATLTQLLALGVVPVVNENDAVADEEIRFGDNDRLARWWPTSCEPTCSCC